LKIDPRNPDAREVRGTLLFLQYHCALLRRPRKRDLLRRAEEDLRAVVMFAPVKRRLNMLSPFQLSEPDFVEAKIDAQRAYESDAYLSVAIRSYGASTRHRMT